MSVMNTGVARQVSLGLQVAGCHDIKAFSFFSPIQERSYQADKAYDV